MGRSKPTSSTRRGWAEGHGKRDLGRVYRLLSEPARRTPLGDYQQCEYLGVQTKSSSPVPATRMPQYALARSLLVSKHLLNTQVKRSVSVDHPQQGHHKQYCYRGQIAPTQSPVTIFFATATCLIILRDFHTSNWSLVTLPKCRTNESLVTLENSPRQNTCTIWPVAPT